MLRTFCSEPNTHKHGAKTFCEKTFREHMPKTHLQQTRCQNTCDKHIAETHLQDTRCQTTCCGHFCSHRPSHKFLCLDNTVPQTDTSILVGRAKPTFANKTAVHLLLGTDAAAFNKKRERQTEDMMTPSPELCHESCRTVAPKAFAVAGLATRRRVAAW